MEADPGSKGKEIGSKDAKKMDGTDENVRWIARALERQGNYVQHGQRACMRTRGTRVDGRSVLQMVLRSGPSPPTDVSTKNIVVFDLEKCRHKMRVQPRIKVGLALVW